MKQLSLWRGATITLLTAAAIASAQDSITSLDPMVVTSVRPNEPTTVTADTKAPAQPVPAHDGADVLKNIPGFAVIRKGGADGDPVLRGMAGSRLGIQVEGEGLQGGCSFRMDPPTAYIFPAAYDRITIVKGPQSVRYGPVSSAGLVRFERDFIRLNANEVSGFASVTIGDFGRRDAALDLRSGTSLIQGRVAATWSHMDDFEDGSGNTVHSSYDRWSTNASVAWTPNEHTFLELTGARSDGEATYADRMMDGAKFDRENTGLRFRRTHISDLVSAVEAQLYVNTIDHVMDNYSLRTFVPSMMMPGKSVANPEHRTLGGRITATLMPAEALRIDVGIDHQGNRNCVRSTMNQDTMPYQSIPRTIDSTFDQTGVFAEVAYSVSTETRLYAGARIDHWVAEDKRATVRLGMMGGIAANPTANLQRKENLPGAFTRVEHDLAKGSTLYFGLGYTERFPDYWEMISVESASSTSGFLTATEKTTQLDAGWLYQSDTLDISASIFASRINDYILIQNQYQKAMGMMGGMGGMGSMTRMATISRNIDARTIGGELGVGYRFADSLRIDTSLAYVRGENDTDARALAQLPPLESKIGFTYTRPTWSTGLLWRIVSEQNRVAINQGNIVGQDIGPSPAFDVVSLNISWAPTTSLRLSAGVDNLFDTTYAEHISRAGAMVAGYPQTTRINEPGRFLWVKCDYRF